jgi:osmotically-inducible protein OsmY
MAESAALVVLSSRRQGDEDGKESQDAAQVVGQILSDLRLAERVERALRGTGYPALRAIEVTAYNQEVVLHGQVASYHMKQLAQTVAKEVEGVRGLRNDMKVR